MWQGLFAKYAGFKSDAGRTDIPLKWRGSKSIVHWTLKGHPQLTSCRLKKPEDSRMVRISDRRFKYFFCLKRERERERKLGMLKNLLPYQKGEQNKSPANSDVVEVPSGKLCLWLIWELFENRLSTNPKTSTSGSFKGQHFWQNILHQCLNCKAHIGKM